MKTIRAYIKRHPVLAYYALVFTISWGGILFAVGVGPGQLPATKEQAEILFPFVLLALFAGPSVAGIALTGLVYGRAGFRNLLTRMTRWRVGARWYAVALLTAPLLVTATLLALSISSPEFLPAYSHPTRRLPFCCSVSGGGWWGRPLGRARLDRVRCAHAAEAASRCPWYGAHRGSLVGVWHFLVSFWGSGTSSGALSLAIFLPAIIFYVGSLPAYRVLMVWVYDRTERC